MKILLLNQPIYNRGDEAAHRSLIRKINEIIPSAELTILLEGAKEGTIAQIEVNNPHNTYVNIELSLGYRKTKILAAIAQIPQLALWISSNRKLASYIKKADIVISAPGGICLGGFYNWGHLYNAMLSIYLKKKIIYYSRSIGPFNPHGWMQLIFVKRAIKVLRKMSFLSLRDSQSMQLADSLHLNYIQAIDTAFLDNPNCQLPAEIHQLISKKQYVVFVPNMLTWHPAFQQLQQEEIDNCYLRMIDVIAEKVNTNIIMLPQLYNTADSKSDYLYFQKLQTLSKHKDKLIIISDNITSDIQQLIISKALIIIGARYHSVIFGINNATPVIALNYEHKIAGVLDILGLGNQKIDFYSSACIKEFDYNHLANLITSCLGISKEQLYQYKNAAQKKALSCFEKMLTII